jgi:3-oxoacyl-[acyl-carrier protein] reductase
MTSLTNKVAIVTGASKGIGAGIAKALGAAGAAVIVNYYGDANGAAVVVAAIEASGGRAVAVQADVSQVADVQRLFTEATDAFGQVNVLVNNAGIFGFSPLENATEADFHRYFNTNVLGVFLTTQAAAKQFGDAGGAIINIASSAIEMNGAGSGLYTASKAAVVAISKVAAKELGARKIRVNAVAPGGTETEGAHAAGFFAQEEFVQQAIAQTPLGRIGQPDDIAPVATFLASDDARWITGAVIFATGGYP